MKIRTEKVIDVADWDTLVKETYDKPYSFQQQNGCRSRGTFRFTVPAQAEDFESEIIPEIVNGPECGVSFAAWLKRDRTAKIADPDRDRWAIELWWKRNFYPNIQMIANDLHQRGLLEAGDYTIDIDW